MSNKKEGLRRQVKDGRITPAQAIKIVQQKPNPNQKFIAWCRRRGK